MANYSNNNNRRNNGSYKKRDERGRTDSYKKNSQPSRAYNNKKAYDDDFDKRAKDSFEEQNDVGGLIVGRNPVIEALKSDTPIDTLYINAESGGSITVISKMAKEKGIVIKTVSSAKLTQMCGGMSHQGVIASGACAKYVEIEDILAASREKGTKPFIIICDEIEDPHNFCAIISTAESA